MIRDQLISSVVDADVLYIYDQRENTRWEMLRGLPALAYLGVSNFTYPTRWCQFEDSRRHHLLDYEYHVVSTSPDIPDELPEFGVITNSTYEGDTQYTIKFLINRYTTTDSKLFVLADTKGFEPTGAKRPLRQENFTEFLGRYSSVYDTFENAYAEAGWDLPLTNTKNLFIQDNAILYQFVTGESLTAAEEVFEVVPDAPFLPLHEPLSGIFSRPEEPGAVPLDPDTGLGDLERWLRRRIEWDRSTAQEIARSLNEAVVEDGSTFDTAALRRDPAVHDGRRAAQELDPEASPIDRRYHDWLTRYEL